MSNIDDVLKDVRKAYRLLASYQQRMLELLTFIRKSIKAESYYYCYRTTLPRTFEGLEMQPESGRRFLSFENLSQLWLINSGQEEAHEYHHAGDILVDAYIVSDTATSKHHVPKGANSTDEGESQLWLYFFYCDTPAQSGIANNWYNKVWSACPEYPKDNEVINIKTVNGKYRVLGICIPLRNLADKSSIETSIVNIRQVVKETLGADI